MKTDTQIIRKIVTRFGKVASPILRAYRVEFDAACLVAVLIKAHAYHHLDLAAIEALPDGDLTGEVSGILFNLDRVTGEFKNGFVPAHLDA